jgi:tetratricopeptide (TPR) repeat protein
MLSAFAWVALGGAGRLLTAAQVAPAPPAVEAEADAEPPPATVFLVVEGGDADTAFRGWPWRITWMETRAETRSAAPTPLFTLSGPGGGVTIQPRALPHQTEQWMIAANETRSLTPGNYTLKSGAVSVSFSVQEAPASLSREQTTWQRYLPIGEALAFARLGEAQTLAEAWVSADPRNIEARTALGDALAAQGKDPEAFAAYQEALIRLPPGNHPPSSLLTSMNEIDRRLTPAASGQVAAVPSDNENQFYRLIDAADALARKGNNVGAVQGYEAADRFYRSHALTLDRAELEEKIAWARRQPTALAAPAPSSGGVRGASSTEAAFVADPLGQWASQARGSSQYRAQQYTPASATGAPDVESYQDDPKAWASKEPTAGVEWLDLTFARAVIATEIRVRQSFHPGAIAKVEVFAADGTALTVWEGRDATVYPPGKIGWFVAKFPPTPWPTLRVKLTLNTKLLPGWKQIDAVQLIGP